MKAFDRIATTSGIILGIFFITFGSNFFLKFIPIPPPEEGTKAALFMGAIYPTGFLACVKIFQILGGLLIAIPKTRNLGLLILGPILLNILMYHLFILKSPPFPPLILMTLCMGVLLIRERHAFLALINRPLAPNTP